MLMLDTVMMIKALCSGSQNMMSDNKRFKLTLERKLRLQ